MLNLDISLAQGDGVFYHPKFNLKPSRKLYKCSACPTLTLQKVLEHIKAVAIIQQEYYKSLIWRSLWPLSWQDHWGMVTAVAERGFSV